MKPESPPAIDLDQLVAALDSELGCPHLPDYGGAWNGLQLANRSQRVTRVAAAVDASLPVFRGAVESGAGLLLVHHGMFWQGVQPLTGAAFEKLRLAVEHNLAVYSAHLPLDAHPTLGNNARLAMALALEPDLEPLPGDDARPGGGTGDDGAERPPSPPAGWQPCFDFKGLAVGLKARVEVARADLIERVRRAVGGAVHCCPAGPDPVRRLAVVTGGAGGEVGRLPAEGVDTLITGEGPHWSYPMAEELGVNVIYAGHYATETFGVKALADWLEQRFGLPWSFIDHPTGL